MAFAARKRGVRTVTPAPPPLLDTDVLSEFFKGRNEHVERLTREYLRQHSALNFSLVTRFEVLRGLHALSATAQLQRFETLCRQSVVVPLSDEATVEAAKVWAHLRNSGQPIGVGDVLIGGTALAENRAVATRNPRHFNRIPNLAVLDWREGEDIGE